MKKVKKKLEKSLLKLLLDLIIKNVKIEILTIII